MKDRWKSSANYDATLSPQGWAWEFLRRNTRYQKESKKYFALVRRYGTFEEAQRRAPASEAWVCEPAALRGETLEAWETRVSGGLYQATALRSAIANRWGLLIVPHDAREPATSKTDLLFFLPTLKLRQIAGWRSPEVRLPLGADQIAIIFDMADPLRPQVARASKFLRETQKWLQTKKKLNVRIDTPKYAPRKLIEYLRILDARSEGAENDEIVSALYPKKVNSYPNFTGRQTLAVAESVADRLRDGGYRELVQLAPKRRIKK